MGDEVAETSGDPCPSLDKSGCQVTTWAPGRTGLNRQLTRINGPKNTWVTGVADPYKVELFCPYL